MEGTFTDELKKSDEKIVKLSHEINLLQVIWLCFASAPADVVFKYNFMYIFLL
jgi:hypothetical protein